MSRRGRPHSDRLEQAERAIKLLRAERLNRTQLRDRLGIGGETLRRILQIVQNAQGIEVPPSRPGRPRKSVDKSRTAPGEAS